LSTLHQSSLGTLYVIAADKLHGLWYTPLLPVFFFISAIAGGLSMVIFESFMSRRAFGKRLEADLLRGLGRVSVVVLAVYVVWRVMDLVVRGNLALAFEVTPESTLFWGEMVLGAIVPACLFASRRVRYSESGLLLAALLTIMGFVVGRLNVAITGMMGSSGTSYTPSWMEFAVTLCVVAAGFVLFGLAAKHLPVFPDETDEAPRVAGSTIPAPGPRRVVGREVLVALWVLLFVGVVAAVYSTEHDEPVENEPTPCASETVAWPEGSLDLPPAVFFEPSADSPGLVRFDHAVHVDPCEPDCGICHEAAWSITRTLRPRVGDRSFERIHEGDLCASCHDGTRAFGIADDCVGCHAAAGP
jgi:c(7)-type cytochrome triheme protein